MTTRVTFALIVVACAGALASASGFTKPNGEFPGGPQTAGPSADPQKLYSTVKKTAAVAAADFVGTNAFTQSMLAQGFGPNADPNKAWTITTGTLTGTLNLDENYAWVDTEPAVARYGFNLGSVNRSGAAGAQMAVGYTPGNGDPARNSVHWIQIIHTNSPSDFGTANGVGLLNDVGFTYYVDNGANNGANARVTPFYDAGYAANGQGFIDSPFRYEPNVVWDAWCFLATGDLASRTLKIYDGWSWGFTTSTVPAPSSLALLALAGAGASRRRR